ncbi:MAG: M56 family metallopeptidase [Candidatus Limnocylindria bacterium]
MTGADRAFSRLLAASLVTGSVLTLPLLITLFPGSFQRALHGYDAIAAVCAAALYQIGVGLPPLGVLVLALAIASLVLGALKAGRTLRRTRRVLALHRPIATPTRLATAARAVGVSDAVVCFADPRPYAYCRGFLRPEVWVSSGALTALKPRELEAVLLHEAFHRRQRDPLRILVGLVLSQLLFAQPLIRLLAARFEVAKELDADRAAVRAQGTIRHLASALYQLGRSPLPLATSELAVGAWSLSRARVDQLCGAPEQELLPLLSPRGRWLTTATLALALTLTLGQATRANLLPAAVVESLEPSMNSADIHTCPLPTSGVLF